MKFIAKEIFAGYDENKILIIGFSGINEHQYFLIQYSEEHDSQDRQLGINTYYIEKNDQSMSSHGGVRELRLTRNKIKIDLDEKGIDNLKEISIEIDFECNADEFVNLHNRLKKVFSKEKMKII